MIGVTAPAGKAGLAVVTGFHNGDFALPLMEAVKVRSRIWVYLPIVDYSDYRTLSISISR
jgi:hypothetical protein